MRRRPLTQLDRNIELTPRRSLRLSVARDVGTTPITDADERDENASPPDETRALNKIALSKAAEIFMVENRDSPSRYDSGDVTAHEALARAGYSGNNGEKVLSKKLRAMALSEADAVDDQAAEALAVMSQEPIENDEAYVAEEIAPSQVNSSQESRGRKGNSGRLALSDAEKARRALERGSIYGYKTFSEYARVVLNVVVELRCTEMGGRSERATQLFAEKLSLTGEPAVTAKYLVRLASDENFEELRRRGGPIFTTAEEETLAAKVRQKRSHYLAVYPREVVRWANELLCQDEARWALTNGEGLTSGWFAGYPLQMFVIWSKTPLKISVFS